MTLGLKARKLCSPTGEQRGSVVRRPIRWCYARTHRYRLVVRPGSPWAVVGVDVMSRR